MSGQTPGVEPVEISAGALHLRAHGPGDIRAVFEACQDPDIQRWTTVPSPYSEDDARKFVTEIVPEGWRTGRELTWAVLDSMTGELLASVGLGRHQGDRAIAEIGFWCAAAARGRGVTTRAVAVVCRWAFAELNLARIEWLAVVGNDGSRRVAEKVGFTFEGTLRSRIDLGDGVRHDAWAASLLAGDAIPAWPA